MIIKTDKNIGYSYLAYTNWKKSNPQGTEQAWNDFYAYERTSTVPLLDGLNPNQNSNIVIQWTGEGNVIITYNIDKTGYYCVDAASSGEFIGKAVWVNGHGYIPASEFVKIRFYNFMTLVYMALFIAWAVLSYKVWSEVLTLQHIIWVLIGIMVVNMALSSNFWTSYNNIGKTNTSLAILMIIFDAARNSLAFFLLLVVSLGWGIIRPSLGSTMLQCNILLALHFASGCLYGYTEAFRDQDDIDGAPLYSVLPISICTTIFYVWTMKAVAATTRILDTRKQTFKLQMFHKMWKLLIINVFVFFAFFVTNIAFLMTAYDEQNIASSWKYRWMLVDGWLNIQFLVSFAVVLYWWAPNSNNHRYGLEQLAHDESDAWERGPSHDGHVMMLADERDFQMALEEADQVADSFALQNRNSQSENNHSNLAQNSRNVFVLDDDDEYDTPNQKYDDIDDFENDIADDNDDHKKKLKQSNNK
ncbi:hypothetical protein AYI70_g11623 [Smittium culicis]|uniref:GOST seven transmembrane domain-containing protein n=1 Tax=Smittium culicis TaxID=133412 RepID=A0A1R1X0Y3_9FUNG|nr:hypothetical protein AYI70_g11623 [Smittium culicis]